MSKSRVLVLTTRYDAGSRYTYEWAANLHADLASMDHTCLLLDASMLCRAGSAFADAVDCVDYVVFYGHGLADEWTALPPGSSGVSTPLVDSASVGVLSGRSIFAVCCHSLAQLGQTYGSTFTSGEFVGYNDVFAFETANHERFRDVVNAAVVDFVKGASRQTVVSRLENAWAGLRDAFAGGGLLQHQPNAFAASQYAEDNRKRIGFAP